MSETPPATIDAYIARFPPEVRVLLEQLRDTIRAAAPDATEKLSYQMPTWHQGENLVHFAGYPHHIGFYPSPSGITAFADALADFPTSKGAVRFPLDRPLPLDLVARITRFRVREATGG